MIPSSVPTSPSRLKYRASREPWPQLLDVARFGAATELRTLNAIVPALYGTTGKVEQRYVKTEVNDNATSSSEMMAPIVSQLPDTR
jgi:hypothetical protein